MLRWKGVKCTPSRKSKREQFSDLHKIYNNIPFTIQRNIQQTDHCKAVSEIPEESEKEIHSQKMKQKYTWCEE